MMRPVIVILMQTIACLGIKNFYFRSFIKLLQELNYCFWRASAHSSDCALFDVEFPLMVELESVGL